MLRSLPINSVLIKNVTEQKEGPLIYILLYIYIIHILPYMYIYTFRYKNTFDTIPIFVISYSRRERGSNIKYIISKQRVMTYRHVT